MPVYVVAQLMFTDVERYRRYQADFGPVFQKTRGKLLSADESPQLLEGHACADKVVLMEFPTSEDAMALLQDPDYQAISQDRRAGAQTLSHLIQGLP